MSSPAAVQSAGDASGLEVVEQSEGKSGVSFNLVVSPAVGGSPLKRTPARASSGGTPGSPRTTQPTTLKDITAKLQAAEERRKSIECEKLDDLAKRRRKAQEVQQAKLELNESFKEKAAAELEQKMEASKENKEAHVQEIVNKLKLHDARVSAVRQHVDKELCEARHCDEVRDRQQQQKGGEGDKSSSSGGCELA